MKQEVIQKKSNSEITFFPRIIREFEDDDEPMYWGGKAWAKYLKIFQKERQILLEAEKANRDVYYNWAKYTGLWDFVEDIVCPADDVFGLRISNTKVRPPSIRVDRIAYENLNDLLGRI